MKYAINHSTNISGIPCGIHITNPDVHDLRWIALDRRGYRADWLERKMTARDEERINYEVTKLIEATHLEYFDHD